MAYKGQYTVKNPKKYLGDPEKVIYRSHWEREVMMFLDENENVLEWGSEEIAIPYDNPVRGGQSRYFPDFIIKMNEGPIKIVEVKPAKQTVKPEQPKRRTQKYIQEVATWVINSEKWRAARELCERNEMDFEIWTEHTLKDLGLLKASIRPGEKKILSESKRPKMKPIAKRKPRPRPTRRS